MRQKARNLVKSLGLAAGVGAAAILSVQLFAQSPVNSPGFINGVPIAEMDRMAKQAAEANAREMERLARIPRFKSKRAWGAVAYDDTNGEWAISNHYAKEQMARNSALSACSEAGGSGCRSIMTYSNQCVAILRAEVNGVPQVGKDSVNTGTSINNATLNTFKSCRDDWGVQHCKVLLAGCSHNYVYQYSGDPASVTLPPED